MSRAVTEWVRPPMEMRSTPVSATWRTVSRVMPPDASTTARPAMMSIACCIMSGGILSSMMIWAGFRGHPRRFQGFHFHLDLDGVGSAGQGEFYDLAQAHFPGTQGLDVVVLNQDAVGQVQPVVVAAAHPHSVLVQEAVARRRLAGVHDAGAAALDGADVAVGVGWRCRSCACMKLSAARSARRMLPAAPRTRAMSFPGDRIAPSARNPCNSSAGFHPLKDGQGHVDAGENPVGLGPDDPFGLNVGRDQRLGGRVVERLVFGQGGVYEPVNFRWELRHGRFSFRLMIAAQSRKIRRLVHAPAIVPLVGSHSKSQGFGLMSGRRYKGCPGSPLLVKTR